jgi:hypothetical protein
MLAIVRTLRGEPAEQRTALVRGNRKLEPPPSVCHEIDGDMAGEWVLLVVVIMMTMVADGSCVDSYIPL